MFCEHILMSSEENFAEYKRLLSRTGVINLALLEGIKVIDFSKWLPGQYCGMLLGDYGADVIKIED